MTEDKVKTVESLLKLMIQYKVTALKVEDIEIAGVQIQVEEETKNTPDSEEEQEDILFYSAGN